MNNNENFDELTNALNNSIEIDTKTFDPDIFVINNCNFKPINDLRKVTLILDFSIKDGVSVNVENSQVIVAMYDDKNNIIETSYHIIENLADHNICIFDICNDKAIVNTKLTRVYIATKYKKIQYLNNRIKDINGKIEIMDSMIKKCNLDIKNAGFLVERETARLYIEIASIDSKKISDDLTICVNIYDRNNSIIFVKKEYIYEDSFKGYDTLLFTINDNKIFDNADHCKIYITE